MSKELNKKLILDLVFGIIFSIGFPAGILLIIFNSKVAGVGGIIMLVCGILLVVVGFYGTPMIWINYGELRHTKKICQQITLDNTQEIKYLAEINNMQTDSMLKKVQELITKRYLIGYEIIDNSYVVPKGNKTISKDEALELSGQLRTVNCKGCGAEVEVLANKKTFCPYCGKLVN